MKQILGQLADGRDLSAEQAREAATLIMDGRATESEMAAFLTAMRMKGETADEMAAIAGVMRERCRRVSAPQGTMDLCGTGGARVKTYNISTVSSIAVAAAGVPVAKHGNRSVTSRSGSADMLEALGLNISIDPDHAASMLSSTGITFLYAPLYHPAMKSVGPVRRALAFRTIFNLLGPLTNPALVSSQLIGVFSADYLDRVAQALCILGVERAMAVHGEPGLDEISPSGRTEVAEVRHGGVERYSIDGKDFTDYGTAGWKVPSAAGPSEGASFARRLLSGRAEEGERSIVLLNAGAALYLAGRAQDISGGAGKVLDVIEKGSAMGKLNEFIQSSPAGSDVNG